MLDGRHSDRSRESAVPDRWHAADSSWRPRYWMGATRIGAGGPQGRMAGMPIGAEGSARPAGTRIGAGSELGASAGGWHADWMGGGGGELRTAAERRAPTQRPPGPDTNNAEEDWRRLPTQRVPENAEPRYKDGLAGPDTNKKMTLDLYNLTIKLLYISLSIYIYK